MSPCSQLFLLASSRSPLTGENRKRYVGSTAMRKLRFPSKVITFAAILIAASASLSTYLYLSRRSRLSVRTNTEKSALESKGLPEFDAENDKVYNVSPQEEKLAERMLSVSSLVGDAKDPAKDRQATAELSDIVREYPDYSDAYFLRATVSVPIMGADFNGVLADIDKAIQLEPSTKYDKVYNSISEMYALRSKVDIRAGDDQRAVNDLETAIKIDPGTNPFNNGGVKPEDGSDPTAVGKSDLDSLIERYPGDYRVYMFRALFYNFFTTFDEQYYALALKDLEKAESLSPNSALIEYLLGSVYQKKAFWTKAAAADISESGGFRDATNAIALQYFDAATKHDPGFTEAWAQVAESLYSLKRYREAIPAYDRVIELDPNRSGAYNDRGLAKTYAGDYYGAIEDFSESIRIKKPNSLLDQTYENRADAYAKAHNFREAVDDYSRAIGTKLASQVFLMSLTQIREAYPEFDDVPDQTLLEGLRQKYYPNMKSADFYSQYAKNNRPFEDFVLAGLYENRGDAYLRGGSCEQGTHDYARAIHIDSGYKLDRWKQISDIPGQNWLVDAQTLRCSQGNTVSVWLKIPEPKSRSYDEANYQIDCKSGRLKPMASTTYDPLGNPIRSTGEQEWQMILPESIGDMLRDSLCGQSRGSQ